MARDPQRKRKRTQLRGRTRWRLFFAAFLCGPLTGLGLIIVLGLIGMLLDASRGGGATLPPEVLLGGAVIGAAFGWPLMIVYGLPAHAILYRNGSHKLGSYVLSGVIGGFLAAVITAIGVYFFRSGPLNPDQFGMGAALGVFLLIGCIVASIIFWLIRRPDRDTDSDEAIAATFE